MMFSICYIISSINFIIFFGKRLIFGAEYLICIPKRNKELNIEVININILQLRLAICFFKSRLEQISLVKILIPRKLSHHSGLIHPLESIKLS